MIFSIIINTHNQYETINRCIKSCLKQNFDKNFEIIVVDTSDHKVNYKVINAKKIRYFHFKKFSNYPELNQLRKVYEGFKRAKGKWFCLMDGDDFFKPGKLRNIYRKYNLNHQILAMDKNDIFNEVKKRKYKSELKIYKEGFLYKNTINFWPEIFGTSSLSGNMKILKLFFKKIHLRKWKYLAIDALLILYCLNKNQFILNPQILTTKSLGNNNLGKTYKVFTRKYWHRRDQQINYWEMISKKEISNVDKLLTKIVNFVI